MTVAERMIETHGRGQKLRLNFALAVSLALIVFGGVLTWKGATGAFTFTQKSKDNETMLTATTPGLFFVLCGTAVMCCAILKGYTFKTQHQDANNPGLTELAG